MNTSETGSHQRFAFRAIDIDVQLRRVGAEHREHADQPTQRIGIGGADQLVGGSAILEIDKAALFHLQSETAGVAEALNPRGAEDGNYGVVDELAEFPAKFFGNYRIVFFVAMRVCRTASA